MGHAEAWREITAAVPELARTDWKDMLAVLDHLFQRT
jgi:hypothetical protein